MGFRGDGAEVREGESLSLSAGMTGMEVGTNRENEVQSTQCTRSKPDIRRPR